MIATTTTTTSVSTYIDAVKRVGTDPHYAFQDQA